MDLHKPQPTCLTCCYHLEVEFEASFRLAAKFRCKPDMTQNSQYLFLFYPCHLFLSSLYLSPCSCRLCHAHFKRLWGCLVQFLSAEVKKHDMPSGYNYPMPATITVVPLQSFPEGRGHGAHTASPYPPE